MPHAFALSQTQVLILRCLAKQLPGMPGLTGAQIEKKSGISASVGNMGVSKAGVIPGSLYAGGYITAEQHDFEGRMTLVYKITFKGRKAAEEMRVRDARVIKIDKNVLDQVVKKFRPTRTYGIDNYTDADLEEIKGMLNGLAGSIALDDLRSQIANRRKQGAYSDPGGRAKRTAKMTLQAFGPDGWIYRDLLPGYVIQALEIIAETGQVGPIEEVIEGTDASGASDVDF